MSKKHEGFTPGPWRIATPHEMSGDTCDPEIVGPHHLDSDECEFVAVACEGLNETEANARLIADAPRLYAETQRLAAQINEAIAILDSGTDYEKMHVVAILRNALEG